MHQMVHHAPPPVGLQFRPPVSAPTGGCSGCSGVRGGKPRRLGERNVLRSSWEERESSTGGPWTLKAYILTGVNHCSPDRVNVPSLRIRTLKQIGFGSAPDPCQEVGSDPCHGQPELGFLVLLMKAQEARPITPAHASGRFGTPSAPWSVPMRADDRCRVATAKRKQWFSRNSTFGTAPKCFRVVFPLIFTSLHRVW